MKNTIKRTLVLFLTLAVCLGMVNIHALAAETPKAAPLLYTDNNIDYELYEDGTAKVVGGEKDPYYRIIVPGTVTYEDVEYRVTVIGEKAFYNKGYAQVTLSEGLETIEAYAFGYTYLYGKELVIPNSVTSIGERAFQAFNRYAKDSYHIDKIILGDGLKTVGYCAFYYNAGVTEYGKAAPFPVEIECGTNLESVNSWAFYCTRDYNDVSSVTVRGLEGTIDSVLQKVYAFNACGWNYTEIDLDNLHTVKSLQTAIHQSNGPTTLTISGDIDDVRESIRIPAGKDITLTDGGNDVIMDAHYSFNNPLFIIEKGGKLTIDATEESHLIINGAPLGKPGRLGALVFQVNGELVLKNGHINGGGSGTGMGMFSGAIVLGDGARFKMTGGILRGTYPNGAHGAPVVVGSGAEFNMSGGRITENYSMTGINDGYAAGAVLLYGWNAGDVGGKMTLSGNAQISNNSTSGVGGAITLVGNAELYMDGGVITGNKSTGGNSSNGGGVCVAGRTGGMNKTYDAKCVFTMNGGEISNNAARYGGGIYVNSNYVTLNAGKITGNKASACGGGVYVETPAGSETGAKLNNAVIYGNTASVMGGGMYFCPTGSASLNAEGIGVFDNTANGAGSAGDDFVSVVSAMSQGQKTAALVDRMLGAGKVTWYQDGTVTEPALGGGWGLVPKDSVRYNGNSTLVEPGTYDISLALKAVVSDDAKASALESAQLIISGNTAERGGGVGANGKITTELLPGKLEISKAVIGAPDSAADTLYSFTVKDAEGNMVAAVQLKAGESKVIENLLPGRYTVTEDTEAAAIGGYRLTVSDDGMVKAAVKANRLAQVTVTNTYTPYGSLTIHKEVVGGGDEAAGKVYTFTVTGPDGYQETVTITGAGSETLHNLPLGTYVVTEEDAAISGYSWKAAVSAENGSVVLDKAGQEAEITFTNSYEPEGDEDADIPDEDIPDDDTPATDIPDEDIPDEDIPATDIPDEDIPDEDIPLSRVPQTGDTGSMLLWIVLLLVSGLGVTGTAAYGKRKYAE